MWAALFRYSSVGTTILLALYAALQHTRVHSRPARLMLWYFYFRALFEILAFITAALNVNNMPLFYLYCVLETILLTVILTQPYYVKTYRKFFYPAAILLMMAILVESFIGGRSGINTFSRLAESSYLFILCCTVSLAAVRSPQRKAIYKLPEYWFSLALMLYFGIHCWVALTSNYSLKNFGNLGAVKTWMFNSLANIITNLIVLCCLYSLYRKRT